VSRALVIVAYILLAGVAHADPQRVVVAASDRVLVNALGDVFAPEGTIVIAVSDAPPAGIATLTAVSRTVAEREHADAVVWLLVDPEGATLVAYDRKVDRVLVRPLPYAPPLSAAGAAETARAARTMLRALTIADEPERSLPPVVIEKPVIVTVPTPPRPWPNLAAMAGFGGRYGRLGEDGVIEGQIAVAWRPDMLGVVAMAALSPRASVSNPAFTGEVSDNSFALCARMPFQIVPRIGVAGLVGPAVHAVDIKGTQGAEEVRALRFDLAARFGATGVYALSNRFDVGLSVSMDTLLRRQKYEVAGGQMLVMPRLQVSVGLMVAVRIL
jgi:hypothetical protein